MAGELNGDEDLDMNEDFFDYYQYSDDIQDHAIAYMASVLEARIMNANRYNKIVKCEECISSFIENELIEDSFIRFKSRNGNVLQPCKSTFEICKFVNSYLKTYEGKTIPYETVALQILRKISFDSLFTGSDFENHSKNSATSHKLTSHRYEFVKKIVDLYMRMKSIGIAKKLTLETHDNPKRHVYKKLIQERGQ